MNNPPGNRYDYKVSNKNQLLALRISYCAYRATTGANRIWQQFK
ncbi:MAG: hypothetical protein K0S58_2861 [Nitrospira sp.]|jgi:hypothetical protein|nr:hypothetical protein [Nitrospira sp.]